jgi:hypothetical protein
VKDLTQLWAIVSADSEKCRKTLDRSHNNSRLIALVLAGAWRRVPPVPEISAEQLAGVTPTLLETGAGGLGWRAISNSELRTTPTALQLRQAHRLHSLQAALHEREIHEVVGLLRSHGVEPILIKGWAVARLYLESGLRPYGDIDLVVHPDQYATARALLNTVAGRRYGVDLHRGFTGLGDDSWIELYGRSQCAEVEGATVRTLGPEDQLRLLCFHFLREGGWRPLWLCDISVALEARGTNFNWDLCLGPGSRSRKWVACTLALAENLLRANMDEVPAKACAKQLPSWLLPSVLKEWEFRSVYQRHKSPMAGAWHRPGYSLKRLRCHWPSPVEATIGLNGPFNEIPRLPFQLGNCFVRAMNFFLRPREWTRQ